MPTRFRVSYKICTVFTNFLLYDDGHEAKIQATSKSPKRSQNNHHNNKGNTTTTITTPAITKTSTNGNNLSQELSKLRKFTEGHKIQPSHVQDPLLWFGFHSVQIQCSTTCRTRESSIQIDELAKWSIKTIELKLQWIPRLLKLRINIPSLRSHSLFNFVNLQLLISI